MFLDYHTFNGSTTKERIMTNEQNHELSAGAKATLKVIFITLFIDLIGFSIIFPLFPALLKHYIEIDPDNFFLKTILNAVDSLMLWSGSTNEKHMIVLFGGILGSLYSLLQFLSSPFWGKLSDKIGRKPVLLISISGLFLSYVLWFFSANFTLIILARIVGGMMAGNISTASAAAADVTSIKNRSKAMAVIGIAFATGFVIGPALGGILSQWDLSQGMLAGVWGVNPFSVPAGFAAILCLINLFLVLKTFKETRKPNSVEQNEKSINPARLLARLPYKEVNLTNRIYFLFLTAFSGMEFTLTFLAADRLNFTPMQNGIMFIFIGFIMAMVQGGFVRRRASKIGEEKLVFWGMLITAPGLLILAFTHTVMGFYSGLFFLSTGAAMIIPCLSALVSIYAPESEQGYIMGVFRSLGSLARVIGPFVAGMIYWRFGSEYPYICGVLFILIPIILAKTYPKRLLENPSV